MALHFFDIPSDVIDVWVLPSVPVRDLIINVRAVNKALNVRASKRQLAVSMIENQRRWVLLVKEGWFCKNGYWSWEIGQFPQNEREIRNQLWDKFCSILSTEVVWKAAECFEYLYKRHEMIEQIDGLQGVLVSREFYQSLTKFYRDHYRDRVEELLWESFSGAQTAYRNVVRMIAKTNNIFRRFPRQNKQQRLDRYHLYQRYIMTFFNFAHYYQPSSEPNDHHREFRSDLRGDEQHESYNFTPDELVLQSPAMRARAQDRSNFRNCRNHTADHWRQLSRKIYFNDIYFNLLKTDFVFWLS